MRVEKADSEATGDIIGADTHSIVPRLGMTYDPAGDGTHDVPGDLRPLLGQVQRRPVREEHQRRIAQPDHLPVHRTGRPGIRLRARAWTSRTTRRSSAATSRPPTSSWRQASSRRSPRNSRCRRGGSSAKGYGRVMYTWRRASNFIEDFIDDPSAAGKITVVRNGVNFGTFDRLEFRNSDDCRAALSGHAVHRALRL